MSGNKLEPGLHQVTRADVEVVDDTLVESFKDANGNTIMAVHRPVDAHEAWASAAQAAHEPFQYEVDLVRYNGSVIDTVYDKKLNDFTGIYVRAKLNDQWGSFDIATLTCESLRAWLRSRGGENRWAEMTVASLLAYPREDLARCWPSFTTP